MRFRNMRHRVTFEVLQRTGDGYGGNATETYTELLTTWGDLSTPGSANESITGSSIGKEDFKSDKLELRRYFKLLIRYRNSFNPNAKYRVRYKSRVFNILWHRNLDESNKWIEFRLEEVS